MKNFPLLSNLIKPTYLLVVTGAAFPFFTFQYYLMASLPGSRNFACTPGANLTPLNIIFALMVSILTGVMISAVLMLFAHQMTKRAVLVSSTSSIASVIAVFTSFCTICTLPVISLLGVSISIEFFTTYNLIFKFVSLIVLLYGLYYVNKRLILDCEKCNNYQFHSNS